MCRSIIFIKTWCLIDWKVTIQHDKTKPTCYDKQNKKPHEAMKWIYSYLKLILHLNVSTLICASALVPWWLFISAPHLQCQHWASKYQTPLSPVPLLTLDSWWVDADTGLQLPTPLRCTTNCSLSQTCLTHHAVTVEVFPHVNGCLDT